MGCKCGSQIILCNLPVRFDTYRGCSHGCRYCFAQKKNDISHIERDESVDGLRSFIEGKRGNETEWCDWNIPIHWGGMSDPFQPVEKQIRASYECLKLLAETKYPFVVSTKGRLIADPEYLDLLAQCNCVLQISMVCSKYDRLERGTPSYEERLTILKTVSARVQRTIVRIQPYMPEVFHDVMKNIPHIAEAGAYGVIVEGMKFFKAKPGMTKIGGDFCYPLPRLRHPAAASGAVDRQRPALAAGQHRRLRPRDAGDTQLRPAALPAEPSLLSKPHAPHILSRSRSAVMAPRLSDPRISTSERR